VTASRQKLARLVAVAVAVAAAALLPLLLSQYRAFTACQVLVFATALMGLTLITGMLGQPSLMHAELMGFGGFMTGAMVANMGINFWLAVLLAVVAGYLVGSVVGLPALRIRGLALAVVTLAIARVFDALVFPLRWLSGGVGGRSVERPTIPGLNLGSDRVYYEVLLVAFLVVLAVVLSVKRGRIGRVFGAIRETDWGSASSGVPLTRYKLLGFSLSAAIAALAGALGAGLDGSVTTQTYPWTKSVTLLAILTVMGSSSVWSPLFAAIFVVLSPAGLEHLPPLPQLFSKEQIVQFVPLISGVSLVLVMIFTPQGLVPTIGARLRKLTSRNRSRDDVPGTPGGPASPMEPGEAVGTPTHERVGGRA